MHHCVVDYRSDDCCVPHTRQCHLSSRAVDTRYGTVQTPGAMRCAHVDDACVRICVGVWTLSFTAEPEDGIVPAGSSVTLHCIVDQRDSASATYIWYRNGKSLSNDKVYTMVAGDLTISVPAGIKDYGKYDGTFHCLVSNKVGQLRSRDASVVGMSQWFAN